MGSWISGLCTWEDGGAEHREGGGWRVRSLHFHVCLQLKGRVGTKNRTFGELAYGIGGRVQRKSLGDPSGHVEEDQQRKLRRNRWRGSRKTRRWRLKKGVSRGRGTYPSMWQ